MFLSKFRSAFRSLSFPLWSVPVVLLILTILSYGLRVFTLGFFWDDWPYLWFFNRLGAEGIIRAFSADRPFLSAIYITSLTLLGHSIQGWQIFAVLARWLCSLGLWWALLAAWPRQGQKVTWVALLFAVYPGFTQQWISVIYGQAFFLFAALFFSIGITLWLAWRAANRARLIGGTLLALTLSAFTMFSTEYFFGLELLRPALLWLILAEQPAQAQTRWKGLWQRAVKVARRWWPYLALMIVFVIWRGFIHIFQSYSLTAMQDLERSPLIGIRDLALTILRDLITSTLVAWGQPLQMGDLFEAGTLPGLRLLGLIILTGLLVVVYLARLRAADAAAGGENHWPLQAAAVGLFAMLASGWPFWITGLPLRMGFPQDRFPLPLAAGVCLLLAALVDWAGKDLPRKALILGLVVALATGFHFSTAGTYREDWNLLHDFLWQLTWRAPAVEPGTIFLSTAMPFHYFEDDSLTAPLNWTFDPNEHSFQMKYLLLDLLVRYHNLPSLQPGRAPQPIDRTFRATTFSGSTGRILVFYYAPPGCVRILDPVYDADIYRLPDRLATKVGLSNPRELIRDADPAAAPPQDIFGGEPKHRWCYYFEKADLARQNDDWDAIVKISAESIRKGYRPEDPAEYLPFIEAYNHTEHWPDAYELTQSAYGEDPKLRAALCASWRRSSASANQDGADHSHGVVAQANQLLKCPVP
jgi:hypothetical protein